VTNPGFIPAVRNGASYRDTISSGATVTTTSTFLPGPACAKYPSAAESTSNGTLRFIRNRTSEACSFASEGKLSKSSTAIRAQ
jgi:hypothetical protein